MPAEAPPSASKYYALSALLSQQTAREAVKARARGFAQAASLLMRRQVATASLAEAAIARMLDDQPGTTPKPDVALAPAAFTTLPDNLDAMAQDMLNDAEFERLVASIMQETARAAQQVSVAARPHVQHVRHLNLPSCSRCAILAGRVYRYSEGFKRHPGCDCVMIPVTIASPDLTYDPVELARSGQVTGLSKADREALDVGADFGQIVNVRLKKAGLTESGRVLARAGRPTPEALLRDAPDRDVALQLLTQFGYVR
jgi:hypothetical protein